MVHHHKSNQEVEGNPDTGHGRGMPRRPNADELAERTAVDRQALGLPTHRSTPERVYEDEVVEIDRQVEEGKLPTESRRPRKDRPPFPPTHYDV
ncbi:hypothetical protein [Streptomyces sp. V3I7]|uniref:hypothetical protein n=1 Tax=Streptomyces sp. V3I7 TaxID=3042278 RepID=UPI0027801FD8|nr:hypothetical protein [Streptomyces sp. V3I7]MDQ0994596.1 hypothetical protein [Streptomyces sp. V3I7]